MLDVPLPLAPGPGAQVTGTEEDNVDQGLVVPEKLFESSGPCQKLSGVIMPEGTWVPTTCCLICTEPPEDPVVALCAMDLVLGPTPKVTLGLLFFMKKCPISSRSKSTVSILIPLSCCDEFNWDNVG